MEYGERGSRSLWRGRGSGAKPSDADGVLMFEHHICTLLVTFFIPTGSVYDHIWQIPTVSK